MQIELIIVKMLKKVGKPILSLNCYYNFVNTKFDKLLKQGRKAYLKQLKSCRHAFAYSLLHVLVVPGVPIRCLTRVTMMLSLLVSINGCSRKQVCFTYLLLYPYTSTLTSLTTRTKSRGRLLEDLKWNPAEHTTFKRIL